MLNKYRFPKNFTSEEMIELRHGWNSFDNARIFFAIKDSPRLVPFFKKLSEHKVVEIGCGKDPVKETYPCGEYVEAERFRLDGLTVLENEDPKSAVVVSFGVIDKSILRMGDHELFDCYAERLFFEIKRVSYPFSILYGKDVERYFGKPDISVGERIKGGGVYYFNS